ncbi:MAG: transposase, partial [Deltaproteobacteria bacterium]|nr:transposase [Deltaproteobacteria bacterium]
MKTTKVELGIHLVMFMTNRSMREMEDLLSHHRGIREVCGFKAMEEGPDHTTISEWIRKIGSRGASEIFRRATRRLRGSPAGKVLELFVDSSEVVKKVDIWKARDKAIEEAMERLKESISESEIVDEGT